MAFGIAPALRPDPLVLAVAVGLDLAFGDPVYVWHPVRLMGRSLTLVERGLRRFGADGYLGGIGLFVVLALFWVSLTSALILVAARVFWIGWICRAALVYALLALGDLLRHGARIEAAIGRDDLAGARAVVSELVGRDTGRMDAAACRRAAVESLSENLTDGFTSGACWYALGGLPALVVFKVVSTMDSMVGYRTPRYLKFGWCGARLDDVMNFLPARFTWVLIAVVAGLLPGGSSRKAWRVGLAQHGLLPSPNSGWSEAGAAGALQRRLVGPIWRDGLLVTEVWLGDPADPPLATSEDMSRALRLMVAVGLLAACAAVAVLAAIHW